MGGKLGTGASAWRPCTQSLVYRAHRANSPACLPASQPAAKSGRGDYFPHQLDPKNMGTCDPTSRWCQGLSSWNLRGSQCPDLSAGGLTKQVKTGQGVDWTIPSPPDGSRLRGGQPAPGSHY